MSFVCLFVCLFVCSYKPPENGPFVFCLYGITGLLSIGKSPKKNTKNDFFVSFSYMEGAKKSHQKMTFCLLFSKQNQPIQTKHQVAEGSCVLAGFGFEGYGDDGTSAYMCVCMCVCVCACVRACGGVYACYLSISVHACSLQLTVASKS